MTEHTPTPWSIRNNGETLKIQDGDGGMLLTISEVHLTGRRKPGEADANAAFIIKAVNNHDALVKALTEMLEGFEPFTSKPMGAPGSDARNQQQLQIAAHRNAREALARLNPPVGGGKEPIDHSAEECPNFPGCHCVDCCIDGWKHPSPEPPPADRGAGS